MPPIAVAKWVDYSNRRGFGCKLTDGTLTVKFNEGACLSWPSGSEFLLYSSQPFGPTKVLDVAGVLSFSERDHIEVLSFVFLFTFCLDCPGICRLHG